MHSASIGLLTRPGGEQPLHDLEHAVVGRTVQRRAAVLVGLVDVAAAAAAAAAAAPSPTPQLPMYIIAVTLWI
eukprot:COSAG01_NODE_23356_length_818_cov_1.132128_1_plen_73_part_00